MIKAERSAQRATTLGALSQHHHDHRLHDGHVGGDGELGFNLVRSSRVQASSEWHWASAPSPWWLTSCPGSSSRWKTSTGG